MRIEKQLADFIERGLEAPDLIESATCFFWPYYDGLHTCALGFAIAGKFNNNVTAALDAYHSFLFPKMERIRAIAKVLDMPEKFVDRIDDLHRTISARQIVGMLRDGKIKA